MSQADLRRLTLILLPGMDGTGELFEPFVAALPDDLDVEIVRYPKTEALGYPELVAFARRALPSDGPFVILGESFSGPVAIELAASGAPGLLGVVLCCTFARNPRPGLLWMRWFVPILPFGIAPAGLLSHLPLGRFSTPARRESLGNALKQVSNSVLRARLQAVLDVDVSTRLAAVKVPLLYLRASEDRLVPDSACALVKGLNSRVRVEEVVASHFLLQVEPQKAASIVDRFVLSLGQMAV